VKGFKASAHLGSAYLTLSGTVKIAGRNKEGSGGGKGKKVKRDGRPGVFRRHFIKTSITNRGVEKGRKESEKTF